MFDNTAQIPEVEFGGQYGFLRANIEIGSEGKQPTLTFGYYWTCKNEHSATTYAIGLVISEKRLAH